MPIASNPWSNVIQPGSYGFPVSGFQDTQLGQLLGNEISPQGGYTDWAANQGFYGMGPRGRFGNQLYDVLRPAYAAVQTRNPVYKWTDFLKTIDPEQLYAATAPAQRGENDAIYGQRTRWQLSGG